MHLSESPVRTETLPEEQIRMLNMYDDVEGLLTYGIVSQKFWLMNDGSVIPVDWEHSGTSDDADVNIKDLLASGAVRGEFGTFSRDKKPFLAIEYWTELTEDQIDKLMKIARKSGPKELIFDDHWGGKSAAASGRIDIKSMEHLDYLLRYGPIKEATLSDIHRKQKSVTRLFPTFFDRERQVELMGGIKLVDIDDDNFHFKVHSGTKKDVWYDCMLHFKNVKELLGKLVMNRKLWVTDRSKVDLRKIAAEFAAHIDVQIFCSCPADLYYGGHYIRSRPKYDAKYTDPENRPPDERNPHQYGAHCKHLQAVMKALPWYTGTIAKWLRDFYANDIIKFEEQARKQFGPMRRTPARRKRPVKPREKPEEEAKPTEGPEEETRPETTGNTSPEKPENERISEAVATLPGPQKKILDKYGESYKLVKNKLWGEEGYYKFWLLNDGTLIKVGDTQIHSDISRGAGAGDVFQSGAIRGHIDSNNHRLEFDSYDGPTEDQIETLKDLIVQYGVKRAAFYGLSTSAYIKSAIKSPDHFEYLVRYGPEGLEERKKP